MCNVYAKQAQAKEIVRAFGQLELPVHDRLDDDAAGDVRPTDTAPIVRAAADGLELVARRWGFAPPRPRAGPVINFRSEGRRFDAGRCLVPALAFYEFTGARHPKTRWRFTLAAAPWFCIAGLWRRMPDGDERFTLLTMEPGPDVAPYHDRQIVVLPRADWPRWLAPDPIPADWLQPLPPGSLAVEEAPR